jgi:5,10-methylenetetrahydromethanopterin reductase
MRVGAIIDTEKSLDEAVAQVERYAAQGYDTAWGTQIFGPDTLTVLAVAGSGVPGIQLGTAVVPVYPRHPQMLAQQALTVQMATGNRLTLGIGLSHQMVIEGMWGYSWEKPVRYMREYLSILVPLLAGETVQFEGEVLTCRTFAPLIAPGAQPPPVLVAALGESMLKLTGRLADGTVTWMTGIKTIGDHIVPTIIAAAEAAGRPAPQVAVALPLLVTADVATAKERLDAAFAIYPSLPSYRAMLEREGAERPSDIALVGTEEEVAAGLRRLSDAGATEVVAGIAGTAEERARTEELVRTAGR